MHPVHVSGRRGNRRRHGEVRVCVCNDIMRRRNGAKSHERAGEEDRPHSWKVTPTSGRGGRREIKEEEEDKGEKVAAAVEVVVGGGGAHKDRGRRRGV